MKIFQEMTFRDIARTMGCSIFTVASRYRYGIRKLRDKPEKMKDESS